MSWNPYGRMGKFAQSESVFSTVLIDDQKEYEAVIFIKARNILEAQQKVKQDAEVQEYLQDDWKLQPVKKLLDSVDDLDPAEKEAMEGKDVYIFESEFYE